MAEKTGILVMAYGSPETAKDIEPYYTDIRRGVPPPPALLEELTDRYDKIGGKSPLLEITRKQAQVIESALGNEYKAYLGMRHWTPWIREAIAEMKTDGIKKAIALVMAPHFSKMSIARYIALVEDANKNLDAGIDFSYIESWHKEPAYIQALTEKLSEAKAKFKPEDEITVIFSAHSLPEKILESNDPYKDQLLETAVLVAKKAGIINWTFAFQSAGRTQEKWLGPDLLEVIKELHEKGVKNILVSSVGFVTDHLEVLYDIDFEAKAKANELGIHLERAGSLNGHPLLGNIFSKLIKEKLNG